MPPDRGKMIFMIAASLALLAGSYATLSYVSTYSRSIEPSAFRSFSVMGEGKVIAKPDVARFTFGVTTQGGKDIAALQKENTEKINRAIAFLKESGVDEKDVKTEYYSVDPRYQYYTCGRFPTPLAEAPEPCPPAEIVGYTISQSVSVKIRDFEKVGDILSGVVKAGANTVSQLSFTIDDPKALEAEARTQAIKEARTKAAEIAKAGNFSVGRLLAIDEGGGVPPIYYRDTKLYGVGGGESLPAPAPAIKPGSQEVTITVTLRYEIE